MKRLVLPLLALGACATPAQPAVWGAWGSPAYRPITIADHTQQPGLVARAVATWNEAVGCELFRVVAPGTPADVSVAWWGGWACGDPQTWPTDATGAYFYGPQCREVYLRRPSWLERWWLQRTLTHELGHAVGLDHVPRGLMAPKLDVWLPAKPSREQAAAVQERVCSKPEN